MDRELFDLADTAVLVHQLMGLHDHGSVVPAIRDDDRLAGSADGLDEVP